MFLGTERRGDNPMVQKSTPSRNSASEFQEENLELYKEIRDAAEAFEQFKRVIALEEDGANFSQTFSFDASPIQDASEGVQKTQKKIIRTALYSGAGGGAGFILGSSLLLINPFAGMTAMLVGTAAGAAIGAFSAKATE